MYKLQRVQYIKKIKTKTFEKLYSSNNTLSYLNNRAAITNFVLKKIPYCVG